MTETADLFEPVVTRVLTSEVHGGPVVVAVGKPLQRSGSWFCSWRIDGIGDEPVSGVPAVGVDGWQALDAAMLIAGAALEGTGHPVNLNGGDPGFRK